MKHSSIPENWFSVNFDDKKRKQAKEFSEREISPMEEFGIADFSGAKFVWADELKLDNTSVFRSNVEKTGGRPRWNTTSDFDISEAPKRDAVNAFIHGRVCGNQTISHDAGCAGGL